MAVNRELITVTAAQVRKGDRGGHLGPYRKVVDVERTPLGQVRLVMQWRNGRFDRATLDPTKPIKVEREIGGAGSALRYRTTSRISGTLVEVWDTLVAGSPVGPDTEPILDEDGNVVDYKVVGRWLTVCVPHGGSVTHQTMALARDHAADPTGWCEECIADRAGG